MIPEIVKDSIDRYVSDKIPTGGFIKAVLSNNLFEAFSRADNNNTKHMSDIVGYIYNEIPSECWGSPEIVEKWLKK